MTESEWLQSDDWRPMIDHIQGRMGRRKSLLYVCAGLRVVWHLLYSTRSQDAVIVAERDADGHATKDEFGRTAWLAETPTFGYDFYPDYVRGHSTGYSHDIQQLLKMGVYTEADIQGNERLGDPAIVGPLQDAAHIAYHLCGIGESGPDWHILDHMSGLTDWPGSWLVREVFGNPFRPITFAPEWRTADVVAIARKAYEDRAFEALPILADAVEEAGCDDVDLLAHLRGDGPHVQGCWALDLVFGKHHLEVSADENR